MDVYGVLLFAALYLPIEITQAWLLGITQLYPGNPPPTAKEYIWNAVASLITRFPVETIIHCRLSLDRILTRVLTVLILWFPVETAIQVYCPCTGLHIGTTLPTAQKNARHATSRRKFDSVPSGRSAEATRFDLTQHFVLLSFSGNLATWENYE